MDKYWQSTNDMRKASCCKYPNFVFQHGNDTKYTTTEKNLFRRNKKIWGYQLIHNSIKIKTLILLYDTFVSLSKAIMYQNQNKIYGKSFKKHIILPIQLFKMKCCYICERCVFWLLVMETVKNIK